MRVKITNDQTFIEGATIDASYHQDRPGAWVVYQWDKDREYNIFICAAPSRALAHRIAVALVNHNDATEALHEMVEGERPAERDSAANDTARMLDALAEVGTPHVHNHDDGTWSAHMELPAPKGTKINVSSDFNHPTHESALTQLMARIGEVAEVSQSTQRTPECVTSDKE